MDSMWFLTAAALWQPPLRCVSTLILNTATTALKTLFRAAG